MAASKSKNKKEAPVEPVEALRFNEGKPELHYILFYPKALELLARVQMQGEIKYGYANWTLGHKPDIEYIDSGLRHWIARFNEEVYDEDSGCDHLGHLLWNILNLIEQNHKDEPSMNPDFNQEAYVTKWADWPKNDVRSK